MFDNCLSLKSLNVDNFNLSSVEGLNYLFYNCKSLLSLNLTNFNFSCDGFYGIFTGCNSNLEYCIDEKREYKFLNLLSDYENNYEDICINWNLKKY